jgi:hypothetical protein
VNGNIGTNEYGNHSQGSNRFNNFYVTWDANNLYVGITNANVDQAAVIYLDLAPIQPVNGGNNSNGTLVGFNYDGVNFAELPFRANAVLYVKNDYREFRLFNGSNGWSVPTSSFGNYVDNLNNLREFSIPWTDLGGFPAAFNWFGFAIGSSSFVYNEVPDLNSDGNIGTAARFPWYFSVVSTANADPTNDPCERISFTHNNTSNSVNFGAISCWDFTMNDPGLEIVRSSSSGGNWNIQNNFVVNDGTVLFGAFGSNYGQTQVNGDVIISGNGSLNMDQSNNALNIGGNLEISSSNSNALRLSSASGGDLNLEGNFIKSSGGFLCNDRQIQFNGSSDQIFESNNTEEVDFLLNSNTVGTLTIQSDVTATLGPNNGWTFLSSTSTIVPASVTITLGNSAVFNANNPGSQVDVFGNLINTGSIGASFNSLASVLVFKAGSTYEHNMTRTSQSNLGRIPLATWESGSSCIINGLTNPNNGSDFEANSEEQSFSNFEWNCTAQSTIPNLSGSTITAESFVMTSTGTGELALGGTTNGLIDCVNYTQTGGLINFATGSGDGRIRCSGIYLHTGGELIETSSGTGTVEFDGSTLQSVTSTGTVTNNISFQLNNPVGIIVNSGSSININNGAFFYRTQGSVTLAGTGNIQYHPTGGRLSYNGNSAITSQSTEFPVVNGPAFLQVDNPAGVSLHSSRNLVGGIFLDNGLLNIGSNNLSLLSGATIGGAPSNTSYINTNGTGELVREFGSSESGNYGYPIGNNGFSPVFLDITNGSTSGNIGFRAVDGNHPNLNGPDPQTKYLSRYWVFM